MLAAALALTLTSCSDAEPEVEAADVVLEAAVADLRAAGTGAFGFALGDESDATLRTEGTYDLGAGTSRFTVSTDDGETQASITQVAHPDEVWMQVAEGKGAGQACWLHVADDIGTPAYVEVALSVEAVEWVDPGHVLRGTVDLALLLNTLGDAAGDLEVDPADGAQADVLVLLDDDALTAWKTDMASVLTAVRDTGVELSDEMTQVVDTGVEVPMMAWFSDAGTEVDHAAPARADVVRVGRGSGGDVDAAVARCAAR